MSRTKAINEKCKDCIYDPKAPGTWREQVQACPSEKSCALWPYRPIAIASVNANRKTRPVEGIDIDSIIADLEDDEDILTNHATTN